MLVEAAATHAAVVVVTPRAADMLKVGAADMLAAVVDTLAAVVDTPVVVVDTPVAVAVTPVVVAMAGDIAKPRCTQILSGEAYQLRRFVLCRPVSKTMSNEFRNP